MAQSFPKDERHQDAVEGGYGFEDGMAGRLGLGGPGSRDESAEQGTAGERGEDGCRDDEQR